MRLSSETTSNPTSFNWRTTSVPSLPLPPPLRLSPQLQSDLYNCLKTVV
ncbi:hypothetical protein ACLBWT_03025 [Paenibacillus sp. D51F]